MLVVVCWGVLGCSSSKLLGAGAPLGSEWFLRRCSYISFGSSITVALLYFVLRRCSIGHLEFVHIPKNAGTSIELAGVESGIFWGFYSLQFQGYQSMPDGTFCSRYHVPPTLVQGHNPYSSARLFCFSRDPYERAVSEYVYLLSIPWAAEYADAYKNGLLEYPECSPEGLNNFVQTSLFEYKSGRKFIDDCHHLPQTVYMFDEQGKQICDDILRTGDLPDAFDRLMIKHGYPARMPTERRLATADVCEGLGVVSLTEATRQLLQEVYADDFRLLNYSMD